MDKSIVEGNKLIAEFMGEEGGMFDGLDENFNDRFVSIPYHSSWDWFHGAWDKFKTIRLKEWEGEGVSWNHRFSFHLTQIAAAMAHLPILNAFEGFVKALQWYNQNKVI